MSTPGALPAWPGRAGAFSDDQPPGLQGNGISESRGIIKVKPGPFCLDPVKPRRPRIGVIRDAAFQFYYPENLEALEQAGADLVFFSPLDTMTLPDIHALYIGGGFPETHAAQLSDNAALREELAALKRETRQQGRRPANGRAA